jgi:hypothetical protein
MTGREIFNQLSYTGLNKIPVIKLLAFIKAGMQVSGTLPFNKKEIPERLLVDGSFVWWLDQFLEDLYSVTETKIIQGLRVDGDSTKPLIRDMRRVFMLNESNWFITDEKYTEQKWQVVKQVGSIKADDLFVFPNEEGILYPMQKLYHRMEEIEQLVRVQTGRSALSMIVSGFVGDIDQARTEFESDSTVKFMPGETKVDRVHATEAVNHLLLDMASLLALYKEGCFDYTAAEDTVESGVSRRLKMAPMLEFVTVTRGYIEEIFAYFQASVVFDRLQIQTIGERTAEYSLLVMMRDAQVITPQEFTERSLDLI